MPSPERIRTQVVVEPFGLGKLTWEEVRCRWQEALLPGGADSTSGVGQVAAHTK